MPINTFGLPYPLGTDAADGPDAIKDLADAVGPLLNKGYANAAARDAAIPAPVAGMGAWLIDITTLTVYDGTTWLPMGGATRLYTPTWTAATTNPVLGNGTIAGRWQQFGKWVHFSAEIVMGSTTTYGAGAWTVSLPVQARASSRIGLTGLLIDQSAGTRYQAFAYWAGPSTGMVITYFGVVGANVQSIAVDNTSPFTWANTDTLMIQGTYEAA